MPELTISQVAHQVGLQPSAIRYYEQIGLLPPASRVSGQRRYDATALYRLALIQRARQLGFTLDDIRRLFFGFRNSARASERWRALSQRKLTELDELMNAMKSVRRLLHKMIACCRCESLDQCGRGIFRSGSFLPTAAMPLDLRSHRSAKLPRALSTPRSRTPRSR